ncbi:MAG: hypothetical protein J0M16_00725 [Gammaproteobacteria bacterium]|nr:hypothetical protein [Gammaproteobacteria bacterium]
MKVEKINGKEYLLPGSLSDFQRDLYIHLINWKWAHITEEAGVSEYRGRPIPYDAILPLRMADELPVVYPQIRECLLSHRRKNPFRLHSYFNHMASSQMANVNLFLPILHHPAASEILRRIKPDFGSLATDQLDQGYCLEFWGGNFGADSADRGPLGDKSGAHGTDSDLAIAYRNDHGELCIWLVEHKLTEREFTPCSGPKSKDRDSERHHCSSSFAEIVGNKSACFHHDYKKRKYWDITEANQHLFVGYPGHAQCPFQGGMNQLWRNLLLTLALEQREGTPYAHASFSVVKHPDNPHLDDTLGAFHRMLGGNPKFSDFTSRDVLRAAEAVAGGGLRDWVSWYRHLYRL